MGRASHSPQNSDGKRYQDTSGGADQAAANDAHQDRAYEGDVGSVEVVDPMARQHAQRDRRAHDEDDLHLLA